MRVEDIEVGKTYAGRKGKPRTVMALGVYLSGKGSSGNVIYTVPGEVKPRQCWRDTFAGWANGLPEQVDAATKDKALRDAAPDLYAALDKLLGAQWMCTVDWAPASDMEPIREEARRALAKARGGAA